MKRFKIWWTMICTVESTLSRSDNRQNKQWPKHFCVCARARASVCICRHTYCLRLLSIRGKDWYTCLYNRQFLFSAYFNSPSTTNRTQGKPHNYTNPQYWCWQTVQNTAGTVPTCHTFCYMNLTRQKALIHLPQPATFPCECIYRNIFIARNQM